jgi:hypothetical protein
MSSNNDVSSIADASRPNAGRIYDYLLGGNHNFEIDRQAAEQLMQIAPGLPTVDHIHQITPPNTKVIYSDIDPVTVSYAKDIIRDTPNVECVECDIRKPELEVVYEWAGEGSMLFISDGDNQRITKEMGAVFEFYNKVGQPVYTRSLDTLIKLIGKWKNEDPGFLPLPEWIDIDKELLDTSYEEVLGGFFVGAILRK